MEKKPETHLKIIQDSNRDMLSYFNSKYIDTLEELQVQKTHLFEIDVKVDELGKTKDLYTFKTNSKKSVFSPIANDELEDARTRFIDSEINNLLSERAIIESKVFDCESTLRKIKKKLELLNTSEKAIAEVAEDTSLIAAEEGDTANISEHGFEFVETTTPQKVTSHGYNILMLDAFSDTFLSTLINKNVKEKLDTVSHKLDLLSYLVGTDAARAKLAVQELQQLSHEILLSSEDIIGRLGAHTDNNRPLYTILDDYILAQREAHPELIIDSTIDCKDYDLMIYPVFTINLLKLMDIFMDNVYRHSGAKTVDVKLLVNENVINVSIRDNGTGISSDDISNASWYSGIHKAKEIIYLLDGTLSIAGDADSGTEIKFNFHLKNKE